jgi:tRNA pseudouridine38-40 synthase
MRTVYAVAVEPSALRGPGDTSVDVVVVTVTADAFLRGMMRAFAGALVSVGLGRLRVQDVAGMVRGRNVAPRIPVAPARGLHQWAVQYAVAA